VEVFEEKRNLHEHSLKIDKCGLSFILLNFRPEGHKVEQNIKMITIECVTEKKKKKKKKKKKEKEEEEELYAWINY
jgi:hypothetical protein